MVEPGRDHAAAETLAARHAAHRQPILALGAVDTVCFQPAGDGSETIAFLDAQFVQALHQRFASGKGGGGGKHRIFVDHRRRTFRRNGDTLEVGRAHAQVSHVLATGKAGIHDLDVGTHLLQRQDQAGAGRVHQDVLDEHVRAGHDQRGNQREARR